MRNDTIFLNMNVDQLIKHLNLKPHPNEGGFFVETYRCDESIAQSALPNRYQSDKPFSTCIYYLLTPETFSEMHRLQSDEVFHFYLGDPVTMLQIAPDGSHKTVIMGQDLEVGHQLQVVVSKNVWQGTFLNEGGSYALLGTTVALAFDFCDYVTGKRDELIALFPECEDLIVKLTRS